LVLFFPEIIPGKTRSSKGRIFGDCWYGVGVSNCRPEGLPVAQPKSVKALKKIKHVYYTILFLNEHIAVGWVSGKNSAVTSFPSTGSPSKENPYAASIWLSSPASAVHRLESHY